MIQGVDNIEICGSDVAKSAEFYDRLGFQKKFKNDLGCMIVGGTARLLCFAPRAAGIRRAPQPGSQEQSARHL